MNFKNCDDLCIINEILENVINNAKKFKENNENEEFVISYLNDKLKEINSYLNYYLNNSIKIKMINIEKEKIKKIKDIMDKSERIKDISIIYYHLRDINKAKEIVDIKYNLNKINEKINILNKQLDYLINYIENNKEIWSYLYLIDGIDNLRIFYDKFKDAYKDFKKIYNEIFTKLPKYYYDRKIDNIGKDSYKIDYIYLVDLEKKLLDEFNKLDINNVENIIKIYERIKIIGNSLIKEIESSDINYIDQILEKIKYKTYFIEFLIKLYNYNNSFEISEKLANIKMNIEKINYSDINDLLNNYNIMDLKNKIGMLFKN
ncbi:hypothetical protein YN1_7660 [Nanoarchaeota archaeon]